MENNCKCASPEISVPEQMPDFTSPGNVGSWRQLLAQNIGRKVRLEIAVLLEGPPRTVCGEIYFVGSSYVALICGDKIVVADTLGIKFAYFE